MIAKRVIFKSIVAVFAATMLFSCGNSSETIKELPVRDTLPIEEAHDVIMYYSDSGMMKAKMTAPLMRRYEDINRRSVLKLPDGLKVVFYDSVQQPETTMTARYGERFDELQRIEVKYDVVVLTTDSKKLYSNHLIWDERLHKIYSDVFVKIITPDKIIWGDGFESDERFDQYHIIRPKGEIDMKEDKNTE
ncbi:MAG: LPS export ABC transporter periplasmic protein LptC [Bacteroidetes bacterium HGW-Bacteroidetes-6]|jgi:LPS export ABC transporter protein LptC|nr:MAG: LPS export ABC transporter periplasmic protein LptC [Bacteroidetes bacterium HGW-Bacteroidetes-6]